MLFNYNHKYFVSNLNNIYFFSKLKKKKIIKKWFLYLYWTHIIHELNNCMKLYDIFCNQTKKYNFLQKSKFPRKLYNTLHVLRLKKYYKNKISLIKVSISYFFDFLTKFIKTKELEADKFFLIHKLKISEKQKIYNFKYFKLLLNSKKNIYKKNYNNYFESDKFLKLKLNLFSLTTYNIKWSYIINICNSYSKINQLNTLDDIMNLLDRKIDYFLNNWIGLTKREFYYLIKNKLISINSKLLIDDKYILENGFIITVDNLITNELIFFGKRLKFLFLILDDTFNKLINYTNWFLCLKIKKKYILNLIKKVSNTNLKKNVQVLKYIDYFYKIDTYTLINIKFKFEYIIQKHKNLKIKKLFLKTNIYLSLTAYLFNCKLNFSNYYHLSFYISKLFINYINSALLLLGYYYLIKKKLIKLNVLKKVSKLFKIINIVKEFEYYLKFGKINILLFMNVNLLLKSSFYLNYNYLLHYIYNTMFYESKLKNFNLYNIYYKIKKKKLKLHKKHNLFIYRKNNYFLEQHILKNINEHDRLFNKLYLTKDLKQFLFLNISLIIKYNYIHFNGILNYKNKILFYNFNKNNSYNLLKSKWVKLFGLKKNLNINMLKKK